MTKEITCSKPCMGGVTLAGVDSVYAPQARRLLAGLGRGRVRVDLAA